MSRVDDALAEVERAQQSLEYERARATVLDRVALAGRERKAVTRELLSALREADALDIPVTELCPLAGISRPTFYRWIRQGQPPALD